MSLEVTYLTPLLQVFDMPRALEFYCGVLGFEIVESAGPPGDMGWAWLRLGNTNLMLNTQYELPDRPAAPDPARAKAHQDTALYFGCADVDAVYRELKSRNVALDEPKIAPYGMKQLYLHDPDGLIICFQCAAK